jgi:hypothetical protein
LLTNVTLQNGSTAAFQYFAYQQPANSIGVPYTDAGGNAYMMLIDGTSAVPATSIVPAAQPLSSPLSTTDSKEAAEVTIKLAVSPGGGTGVNTTSTNDSTVDITDAVVLRLTPAANHVGSGANFLPCQ